jgi:type VII secretion protein EccB
MARTPVTKVQLDAYRFGQRRMESALARRDPVLLHEEIRGQRRVVASGLALAMLALVAMFAYAKLVPKPDWQREMVIAGKQSGRYFAVIHNPDRLVPVQNLAAARLVLFAARGGSGGDASATATATAMDDKNFDTAPRTASAAVPGAAASLPSPDAPPPPAGPWALCGTTGPNGRPTTALIADTGPATPLGPHGGVLLKGPDRVEYLVVNATKYRIDAPEALAAYDLRDHTPRPVSASLLAAIPDGKPLDTLALSGAGQPVPALPGHSVGDIVRVVTPGQPDRDYLVLANGVQEVSAPVAGLIRAGQRSGQGQPPDSVRLDEVNALNRVSVPGLSAYPTAVPGIVDLDPAATGPDGAPTGAVCWQWSPTGLRGTVTTAAALPVPDGRPLTRLARAGDPGQMLDEVSLPASGALVACAVSAAQPSCGSTGADAQQSSGALWLVSETGVGYPIANAETAGALGVRSSVPVPADALRALAAGPTLDVAQARRSVDVLSSSPDG